MAEVARLHHFLGYRGQEIRAPIQYPLLDLGQHPSIKGVTSVHSVLLLYKNDGDAGYLHPVDRGRYSRMPRVVYKYLPTPTQK